MRQGIMRGVVAVVLGLVFVATPATAQIKWGLGIGPTIPMGTLADGFSTGFHAVGIANFDMTAKPISIRTDVVYNVNKCDGCGDATLNLLTLSGDIQYNFPTPSAHPYILGGLTWGRGSLSGDDVPPGTDAQSDFGFNVGGGLHFNLGPTKAFVEARYFAIGGDLDAHLVPISLGIRF